jgi:alpha-N-arabinofuranosidase
VTATSHVTRTSQQVTEALVARVAVNWNGPLSTVSRDIYGQFLESNFYGNIQGGVFDPGSKYSLEGCGPSAGLRADVVKLCKELSPPLVRWPGGNFASAYHWQDGIGPRELRPARFELAWGGVETNHFGTDEFLTWCEIVGTEPYLVVNCRDLEEAVRWVEYTNYGGDTAMARQRRENGREQPWGVRYWGLGNEVYGPWQVGHRPATAYAQDAAQHARFMRMLDPSIRLVAVGRLWDPEAWLEPLLSRAGPALDYVSLHLYGASMHLLDPGEYQAVVAQAAYFEHAISDYAEAVEVSAAKVGLEHPLSLALDEWNMRHMEPHSWPEPAPSEDGSYTRSASELPKEQSDLSALRVNRWSPRTLADALFTAGVIHAMHRLASHTVPPRMANLVNLVNANGVVVARPQGALRSALFHVLYLYSHHTGTRSLPVAYQGPAVTTAVRQGETYSAEGGFRTQTLTLPVLDVIATCDEGRHALQVAGINRDPSRPVRAHLVIEGLRGGLPSNADLFHIGASSTDLFSTNTFDHPNAVSLTATHNAPLEPDNSFVFPPHSISLLYFEV